ncbi:YeiH family protein [Glutamicibacter sp. NPDC087344]|uniref:YeiH family protein n=1 Tax=Glutamicibacter sp. NPDC087344 TaxID=3363994 RepID=UPI003808A1AB
MALDEPQRTNMSATSAASSAPASTQLKTSGTTHLSGYLPGIILCLAVGGISLAAAKLLPAMSPLLIAILLGALWRNLAPVPAVFDTGVAFSAKKLLRAGIVLLGLQLSLGSVLALGPGVLAIVVLSVGVTFLCTVWIGGRLGIELPQRLLIAAGFSICGAAAVAGAEGATGAKQNQVATAVGLVVLFGTLMIPLTPALGALLGLDETSTGVLIGASTHEVAQVVAAGGTVGATALGVAVTVKLARVAMLAPVMAGLSLYMSRKHKVEGGKKPAILPLFVALFLIAMMIRTTGVLPESVLQLATTVQSILLAAAMFALGLGVHLKSIVKSGGRTVVLALLSTIIILLIATVGACLYA